MILPSTSKTLMFTLVAEAISKSICTLLFLTTGFGNYLNVLNIFINCDAVVIASVDVLGVDDVILLNPLNESNEPTVANEVLLAIKPVEPVTNPAAKALL